MKLGRELQRSESGEGTDTKRVLLAVGFRSGRLIVYDCTAGTSVSDSSVHSAAITAVNFHCNLENVADPHASPIMFLAAGSAAGAGAAGAHATITLLHLQPASLVHVQELTYHAADITKLFFTPNGWLLSGDAAGKVAVWDMIVRKVKREILHKQPVHDISVHPQERVVTVSSGDGTIRFWNLNSRDTGKWCSAGKTLWSQETYPFLAIAQPSGAHVAGIQPSGVTVWAQPRPDADTKSKEAAVAARYDVSLGDVVGAAALPTPDATGDDPVAIVTAAGPYITLWRLLLPGTTVTRPSPLEADDVPAPLRATTAAPHERGANPKPLPRRGKDRDVEIYVAEKPPPKAPAHASPPRPTQPDPTPDGRPPFDNNPVLVTPPPAAPLPAAPAPALDGLSGLDACRALSAAGPGGAGLEDLLTEVADFYRATMFREMFRAMQRDPTRLPWVLKVFLEKVDFGRMELGLRDLAAFLPLLTCLVTHAEAPFIVIGLCTLEKLLGVFSGIIAAGLAIPDEMLDDPSKEDKRRRAVDADRAVVALQQAIATGRTDGGQGRTVRAAVEATKAAIRSYEATVGPARR